MSPIPVTVFTGFLGSGKTTIILSLLSQLPTSYQAVLLKNEFGDIEVDSQLAKQSSLAAVSEILNGCMCCVLVGQMKTALLEIRDKFRPDRIIIESSGSAFPATLAFQIRDLERETGDFKLDAIVTVIDAENFMGYEDTSVTAKMQAQYTDLILVNKWELVSERQLDNVMDHLFTLNELTPKLRCPKKAGVDPSIIFGLDAKLSSSWLVDNVHSLEKATSLEQHHDEIETTTIWQGSTTFTRKHQHDDSNAAAHHHHHGGTPQRQVQCEDTTVDSTLLTHGTLESALSMLPKEAVYRVKGFIELVDTEGAKKYILNWAFGRWELTPLTRDELKPVQKNGEVRSSPVEIRLTMMGESGEIKAKWGPKFAALIGAQIVD